MTCAYGLDSLDFRPPLNCLNRTDECELEWPCELRVYYHDIHPLVDLTEVILSYGTISICILGIILNGLSFYVLTTSGLGKNGSGIYLLALSVCDTGNLIFNYAMGVARGDIEQFNNYFLRDEWLCRFHGVFVEIFQLISAWIVVCFTIERCVAVWKPILVRAASPNRSKLVVTICSISLTLFSLSKLLLVGFEKDSVFGYVACTSSRHTWEGMAYIRVAFQTWIPTVLVAIFNCLMFWKLRRIRIKRKRLTGQCLTVFRHSEVLEPSRLQRGYYRTSQTTPMLIAVSLAYLILVLPLGAVQTIELHWNMNHRQYVASVEPGRAKYIHWKKIKLLLKYIRSFCFGFYQINFAINFFLYCAAGVQFRTCLYIKLKNCYSKLRNFICFNRRALSPVLVPRSGINGGGTSTRTMTSEIDSTI